jgi:acetyl esterase/lipase
MSIVVFVLGSGALGASVLGLVAPRRPHSLAAITFFIGWLAGDLAAFHVVAKLIVVVLAMALTGGDVAGSTLGTVGVVAFALSMIIDLVLVRRQSAAAAAIDRALLEAVPDASSVATPRVAWRDVARPFPPSASGVTITRDIAYGDHRRHRLDVFAPAEGGTGRPVLVQIHGGAWFSGSKEQQGQPLMRHLARRGWVCVAVNYRLSPAATFPDHLIDAKRALAWVRHNIAAYGGDPTTIAVTGGSAGGHLAALVGVTANDPVYQPGFEDVDTSVVACVPIYAVLDLVNTAGARAGFTARTYDHLMSRVLMQTRRTDDLEGWTAASPLSHVRPGLPPFLVVHGRQDTLVWIEEARFFVESMRRAGNRAALIEVPYAQHAFDIMVTRRSIATVRAITTFLEETLSARDVAADTAGGAHD